MTIKNTALTLLAASSVAMSAEGTGSGSDLDLINSLGLGDAGGDNTGTVVEGTETAAVAAAPVKRTEIKLVGEIKRSRGAIPDKAAPTGFGGKRGSKYPFESLEAPNDEGFDAFTVYLAEVENADAKKLQSAIQAAVASQNKQAKDEGKVERYVSRTVLGEDGAYIGSAVYRTDKDEDAEEAAAE